MQNDSMLFFPTEDGDERKIMTRHRDVTLEAGGIRRCDNKFRFSIVVVHVPAVLSVPKILLEAAVDITSPISLLVRVFGTRSRRCLLSTKALS